MERDVKTASELEAIIMQRTQGQPNREVRSVAVVAGDQDGRVIVVTVDGRLTSVEGIDDIGDELRGKYDLAHSNG